MVVLSVESYQLGCPEKNVIKLLCLVPGGETDMCIKQPKITAEFQGILGS